MRISLASVALVLAAACSSGTKSPTPPTNTGTGEPTPNASETACSADDDCVVVETQCCDHCNGGKAEAYNKQFAEAHRATGCEQTMCTQMACGAATAACEAGTCKVTIQPLQ